MTAIDDLVLRYHARLDGLASATLADMAADIDAALATVEASLRARLPGDAPFTYLRLEQLRTELTALRLALAGQIPAHINAALDAVIETAATVTRQTLAALDFTTTTVPIGTLAAVKDRPFDGFTWTRWGAKLADDTLGRVESELRQAAALGEGIPAIRKRLATAGGLSKQSAERLARTAINAVGNRARVQAMRDIGGNDLLKGWRFSATLDARTSSMCRGLDGVVFAIDDPKTPFPPRHPNCRSVMLPELKTWRELGIDEDEVPETTRASMNGQVAAGTTYQDWLRKQPEDFQREVLGPVRFTAFQRGLHLGSMATYDRPLTIAELRRLYPHEMKGL